MDMTLYALLKGMINNIDVEQVNGIKIEIVDSLPTNRDPNTLYIIMGEEESGD